MSRKEEITAAAQEYYHKIIVRFIDDVKIAFIKGIEWSEDHPRNPWHKVSDELPEDSDWKLVHVDGESAIGLARFDKEKGWMDIFGNKMSVGFWMDVPKLPTA